MEQAPWAHRAAPDVGATAPWAAAPADVAELSAHRTKLRALVHGAGRPAGAGDESIDELLLAFEELGSNGLRHGTPPIRVTVATTRTGWVLDVSDAAVDRPPVLAVGRDPSQGGMGLYLVARLAGCHGWEVRDGRKHVWACIQYDRERAGVAGTEGASPA